MALTLDLGILATACALFYLGAKVIGGGEKELVYIQYVQIISKWLFLFLLLFGTFEIMGNYGSGSSSNVTMLTQPYNVITANVPLYCSGGNILTECGTTNTTAYYPAVNTTTYTSQPAAPELTELFIAVMALWLMMFILDMLMLLPRLVNSLKTRGKR